MLQGVSRTVQKEAEVVFWGSKNEFVFPVGTFDYPVYFHGMGIAEAAQTIPPIKNVSFAFDQRDYEGYELSDAVALRHTVLFDDPDLTGTALRDAIHDYRKDMLVSTWDARCRFLTVHMSLKRLQIDFEDCFCPSSCCRMVDRVCNLLAPWMEVPPEHWEIIGFWDQLEVEMIRKILIERGINEKTISFRDTRRRHCDEEDHEH